MLFIIRGKYRHKYKFLYIQQDASFYTKYTMVLVQFENTILSWFFQKFTNPFHTHPTIVGLSRETGFAIIVAVTAAE